MDENCMTIEEFDVVRLEAKKMADELEVVKTTRSEEEMRGFMQSERAKQLLTAALTLAIIELEKLPGLEDASTDRADLLSLLLDGFPRLGRWQLVRALSEAAIVRPMVAADPRSGD